MSTRGRKRVASTDFEDALALTVAASLSSSEPTPQAVEEVRFFEQWCSEKSRKLVTVFGDGHCLFRCLHLINPLGPPDGSYYRRIVAVQMRSDLEFYRARQLSNIDGSERVAMMGHEEFIDYVDAVERGERAGRVVYGDHLCVHALSQSLQVAFCVVSLGSPEVKIPEHPLPGVAVHFLAFHRHSYSSHHYNLLLPLAEVPLNEVVVERDVRVPSSVDDVPLSSRLLRGQSQFTSDQSANSLGRIRGSRFGDALLSAVAGVPSSKISIEETKYPIRFPLAVIEVRDVLVEFGWRVNFAPSSVGGAPHVTLTEKERIYSLVLRHYPRGSLHKLLDEEASWYRHVSDEINSGRKLVRPYLIPTHRHASSSLTAPSQQFRTTGLHDDVGSVTHSSVLSRRHIQSLFDAMSPDVYNCRHCGTKLLGGPTRFREKEQFCCDGGRRRHDPWHPLPPKFDDMVFTKCARVINCLLSPTTIHGDRGEGLGYRYLSYQAPVMTINGQLYARFMRYPSNCWFLNDSTFDQRLHECLTNADQIRVLHAFYYLLVENHSLNSVLKAGWRVSDALRDDQRVWVTLEEDTRLCAVYISNTPNSSPGARFMHVLGGNTTVAEDDPEWELYAYPIMHYMGDARKAWYRGKLSLQGRCALTLKQYLRSVILTEPGFWRFGRLAEQFVLDTWARVDQMNVAFMMSDGVQRRLRDYARACGRSFGPDKVFLPSSEPGSYAYQRRFFHDVMHISKVRGASHLFITFTCNPNWPEVVALLGGHKPDFSSESHQALLARVFVFKRKQFIQRLMSDDYLFRGHRGTVWIVYSTEWQKGDLPHAHIACRLNIDTAIQPMATLMDQLGLMEKIISAKMPSRDEPHYHQVVAFMQHPDVCKSCLKHFKGCAPGEKRCRFRFPKPVNEHARVDMKGFPVYARGPSDVRIVPHNPRSLEEFNCHINFEFTFLSMHFAYLYSYLCKGVDRGGFRISDQVNEISAHRKARFLSPAEVVYKTLGFNVNFRDPPVVVCPIHLPRGRQSEYGEQNVASFDASLLSGEEDVFGEQEGEGLSARGKRVRGDIGDVEFSFDFLDEYFRCFDRTDNVLFCQFYQHFYLRRRQDGDTFETRNKPILARMPWYPPTAGPIYFLRLLLLHVPARSFTDLYGGFPSFKEHCVHLGLIDDGEEYHHGMCDAIESGRSPAECRHLMALFLNCVDTLTLKNIWGNDRLRRYLISDFLPSEANGDSVDSGLEIILHNAETFAIMDIATMLDGMGSEDFFHLFTSKGLPEPTRVDTMACLQDSVNNNVCSARVFSHYATIVGYSVREQSIVPLNDREIFRFRERTKILSHDELLTEVARLNTDQLQLYTRLEIAFESHQELQRRGLPSREYLFNINASAGCGKTFVLNRIIASIRRRGVLTASVCSVGIGALLYDDGRTVHNMFKIPIRAEKDVLKGLTLISTLNKILDEGRTTGRINFLKTVEFLSWDEIGCVQNAVFLAVDHLMRRIKGNPHPFGGCFVVTLGDWKQLPPVDDDNERVRFWDGDEEAFVSIANLSVKTCPVFVDNFKTVSLTINERARFDPDFNSFVRSIGLGELRGNIPLEAFPIQTFETVEEACQWLYEDDICEPYHPPTVAQRCILSPFNKTVDMINEYCEQKCSELHKDRFHLVSLLSVDEFICSPDNTDSVRDAFVRKGGYENVRKVELDNIAGDLLGIDNTKSGQQTDENDNDMGFEFDVRDAVEGTRLESDTFTTEVLNGMSFKGTPPHELRLYIGAVVILLRNLDPANKLQNGVRLIVKEFIRGNKVIVVTKAEDELPGMPPPREFLLHRIKFECRMGASQDAMVVRKQFPVRLANALSIHKSQSMTLGRSVFDVREGVFEHGQCFVALSRNRRRQDIAFLIRKGQQTFRNIVLDVFIEGELEC